MHLQKRAKSTAKRNAVHEYACRPHFSQTYIKHYLKKIYRYPYDMESMCMFSDVKLYFAKKSKGFYGSFQIYTLFPVLFGWHDNDFRYSYCQICLTWHHTFNGK